MKQSNHKKILIYGGAFSPPHIGHAMCIEAVLRLFPWKSPESATADRRIEGLFSHRYSAGHPELGSGSGIPDRVRNDDRPLGLWIMPSNERLDKKIGASGKHRLAMLRLMIDELFPNPPVPIKFSTIELDRPDLSTTWETKNELERLYPNYDFYFLIGSDLVGDIKKKWVNGKLLYNSANFVVYKNPLFPCEEGLPKNFTMLSEVSWSGISSTYVRKLIRDGYTGTPYITEKVADYILKNNLYHP